MATRALPDLDVQFRALREGAGFLDRTGRATLELRGPDAAEYLQGQVTNDVLALAPLQGCYAAMLNPKGRIVADLRILRPEPERFALDTEAGALDAVLRDLRMYKIGRRVDLEETPERALVSLIGPRADEIAEGALGIRLPVDEHALAPVERTAIAIRTAVGIDILVDEARAGELRERIIAAGAQPVSVEAAEVLRIEHGRPRHGLDMTEENFPAEVGIVERAVSFTKGCYVGQETVARLHYKGKPNRSLRGLKLTAAVERGAPIVLGEREVGTVGSTCVSPAHGPIALALVRREASPGDTVTVGPDSIEAAVIELPFERA